MTVSLYNAQCSLLISANILFNLMGPRLISLQLLCVPVNTADHIIAMRNLRKRHDTNNLLVYVVQTLL